MPLNATTSRGSATRLAGAHVLIVDDEADARELLRFVLEAQGAEVTKAQSAEAALRALAERKFDVMVADIGMPGRDGLSLIRAVRSLPASSGGATPAIAVTAYASLRERADVLDAGYTGHLPKPVAPDQLIAMISDTLSTNASRRQRKGRRSR